MGEDDSLAWGRAAVAGRKRILEEETPPPGQFM